MKLKIFKYDSELNHYTEEQTLFKDIPTLGIAFTCVDNWCSDNGREIVTMNDIDYVFGNIIIHTIKSSDTKDNYDIVFKIIND